MGLGSDWRFHKGVIRDVRLWNRSLTALDIKNSAKRIDIGTNGLVSEWKLNEGYGQIINDSIGSNHGFLGDTNTPEASDPEWVIGTEPQLPAPTLPPPPSCDPTWHPHAGPSWLSSIDVTLHVDQNHIDASDSNPGTDADEPLLTVERAAQLGVANKQAGLGTKILIHPGVYRESMNFTMTGFVSSAPLVLEATDKCQAIISGSDIWNTGWSAYDSNIYVHNWPYDWGPEVPPPTWPAYLNIGELARRRELVFVDGELLTQVLFLSDMTPGKYLVNETDDTLYVWPQSGVDFMSVDKEIGVRSRLMIFEGGEKVALIGLMSQHAVSRFCCGENHSAIEMSDIDDVYVRDVTSILNNQVGFQFRYADNVETRNSVFTHNGIMGMGAYKVYNYISVNDENSYNNWRGALAGFRGWHPAGQKALSLRNATYTGYIAIGNEARGLWFDWDNQNVTVDGLYSCNNKNDGLFIEASQGPVTIKNSVLCNNNYDGIKIGNSEDVWLDNNTIYGNRQFQIAVVNWIARNVTDHITGVEREIENVRWNITENRIMSLLGRQKVLHLFNWTQVGTFIIDNNTWYNAKDNDNFKIQYLTPSWYLDFAGWQSYTGQDQNSVWEYFDYD